MSDLIDRQAAIDALERKQSHVERPITETGWFDLGLKKAQEVLSELPSAQLRKKGKWIEYNATGKKQWMCSECCAEEKNPKVARFCYWCGALMKGEEDERIKNS